MKPTIDSTTFGSITIDGNAYEHDVIIRLDGTVKKRKKELSKARYGTSHTIAREEAEFVFQPGATLLVIGAGQNGCVELSSEAVAYLTQQGCAVRLAPTPAAVQTWNNTEGKVIGLFHTTC